MRNSTHIELKGVRDVMRALERLPDDLQRSAENSVLRAGAKPILKAAKLRTPQESGLLYESLGINVRKVRGQRTARVGARNGRGRRVMRNGRMVYSDPAKYSHLVEYGTSHSPARPFIRPAVESAGREVVGAMADGYRRHLTRAAKRLRKRRR